MEIALVLAFFGAITISPVLFDVYRTRRRRARWSEAAEELGFTYDGIDQMAGDTDGIRVHVDVVIHRHHRRRKSYQTIWSAETTTVLPLGLELRPEGLASKLAARIGFDDLKLGIPDLDDKLVVRCDDLEELEAWVEQPQVVEGLRELAAVDVDFVVSPTSIRFERPGQVSDIDAITKRARQIARLAQKLERHE